MHLKATGHGCSEASIATSVPVVFMDALPCGVSQLPYKAVWAHRAA